MAIDWDNVETTDEIPVTESFYTPPAKSESQPESGSDSGSADFTCEVCGKALTYGGRGRHPRFCDDHKPGRSQTGERKTSRRSRAEVDSAIAVLGGMYDGLTMALLMVSPPAASRWVRSVPDLQKTNEVALTADPDLCASINRMAKTNAKVVFFGAHVMAVAPVVLELRHDLASRRRERQQAVQEPLNFDIPDDASGAYQSPPQNFPNEKFFG